MSYSNYQPLKIHDIMYAGVPNEERFGIYVQSYCDLENYCVMIAHKNSDGSVVPLRDNLLWFGKAMVGIGDWIMVYTAPGVTRSEMLPSGNKLISVHWGKESTVFQNRSLTPILCQLGGVYVPEQLAVQPQTQLLR